MAKATTPKAAATAKAKQAAKPAAARKPRAKAEAIAPVAAMEIPPVDSLKDQAANLAKDAAAKAKDYANTGKDKTAEMMDELGRMAEDVAATLDERFGAAYGDFVRKAGESVSGTAEKLKGKDVDGLLDDARNFVREKPAIAIGAAAVIGFALTRLFRAGDDD